MLPSQIGPLDQAKMDIDFVPIKDIRSHEEIVESAVLEVGNSIEYYEVLLDPVIVVRLPSNSYIIADGHHRLQALDAAGYDLAICHIIESHDIEPACKYENEEVTCSSIPIR